MDIVDDIYTDNMYDIQNDTYNIEHKIGDKKLNKTINYEYNNKKLTFSDPVSTYNNIHENNKSNIIEY